MIVGRRQGEHTEKAFVEVSILGRCFIFIPNKCRISIVSCTYLKQNETALNDL